MASTAIAPLKHLTVSPLAAHTATVIFVHGLGDTGNGWKPVADMFRVEPALKHIKWVLPHSPIMSVTANMGMEMPSWFDIASFGLKDKEDEAGMLKTVKSLTQLIDTEVASGVDPNRIILGGFSQGAAMSLLTGLTMEHRLAGIVALSGWVALRDKLKSMLSGHATSIPIFVGHGSHDPLIKLTFSRESVDFLKDEIGIPEATPDNLTGLSYHVYQGVAHTASPDELDDLKAWITKIIPA
ncbi:Phospholipase/carboxylesterase [Armillaria gallica]|uniref:Acyl-protein thioesterase 1 n=1 Tax=Armillaria gallica TaxID=47427 RepID=A0A2H3ETP8_ARMGA|nr:Phospholipase/carboxylesterase [Armillaria gallica]